jgi:hypothetical protein
MRMPGTLTGPDGGPDSGDSPATNAPAVDIAGVREAAGDLAGALAAAGAAAESRSLRDALRVDGPVPEQLLVIRSALVATRNRWEDLSDREAVAAGRRALAVAKRLAIDL